MIDETTWLAALTMGQNSLPKLMQLLGAILPPFALGCFLYKANRFLAAVGFATLHVLFYGALCYLSSGSYAYFLYKISAPLHQTGYSGLLLATPLETALIFGLPAAIHVTLAAPAGLALWRSAVKTKAS